MKNILIGSNGGLTGIYLAKKFSETEDYKILGTDSSALTAGTLFVDKQYSVPDSESNGFLDSIIDILVSEKIDYYFPTHSKEIRVISMHQDIVRNRAGAKFIVSPIKTFDDLEDKENAYYNLSKAAIPTPKLIENEPEQYPIIMKAKRGSGSSGVQKITHPDVFFAYRKTDPNVCFFEWIEGSEYTVDCVFDAEGNLLAYNCRKRDKVIGGAAIISSNSNEVEILPWIRKMAKKWKFCGCVNFQFILRDGIPFFTDINLRYPSGGLPLTVRSGIDIPCMLIRILNGEKIRFGEYRVNQSVKTMFKYFDEMYACVSD